MRRVAIFAVLLLLISALAITASAQVIRIGNVTYYYDSISGTYKPYPVSEEVVNPETIKPQATTTTGTANVSNSSSQTFAPVVPIPLWSVDYATYTAQFIGEDKVIVYTSHGDMDLGHRYISIHPNSGAYIYDVKTGKLLQQFSGGTTGGTFDLSTGTEVWSRGGFFSGNGRYLVEDPQAYGTGARVVDLETKTVYPINWAGTAGIYYATQMDYYGQYIAVGENINNGRVLVFKFNGSAYNLIWNSTPIGQVRRLFLTLDAKYLIYGALGNPYLYIAENTGNGFSVIAKIPLAGGVGALTCTDPYKVGYILVGTDNGHIYIFDTHNGTKISDPDLIIHLNSTQTGTTGRFYNPFYNRWSPANVMAVAFSTSTDPYVSVIIDIHTGKYYRYSGSGYGKATAMSLQGNYVFAGRTLYILVKPDVEKYPRLRFYGTLKYSPTLHHPWELGQTFIIKSPKDKPYKVYFDSGRIKITYVYSNARPVSLIKDEDIKNGRLGKLIDKGLIRKGIIYLDGASVKDEKLYAVDEHTVAYERTHVLERPIYEKFFGVQASTADSGVVIKIPVDVQVSPFTNLSLKASMSIVWVAPVFDWKKELLGVTGLSVATDLVTARAMLKGYGSKWLARVLTERGFDELAVRQAESLLVKGLPKMARGLELAVGVALIVDAGAEFYTHWQDLQPYSAYKTTIYTIPIFEDTKTGAKYAVVDYFLPSEASKYEKDFRKHVIYYINHVEGIPEDHIGIRFDYIAGTWKEYNATIASGNLRDVDLLNLAKNLIPVPTDRLKLVEVLIVVDTITEGYTSAFDLLGGGFEIPLKTIVSGNTIDLYGYIPEFKTSDPEKIASLIPKIEVNGQLFDVHPSSDGAVAEFSLPIGSDTLVLRFPNAEYMQALFDLDVGCHVVIPMVKKNGYYEGAFHYDWVINGIGVTIIEKRAEFVDMEYPMVYAERIMKYVYGEDVLPITKYFELKQVVNDPTSPTGKRYYYVTMKNMTFLDPTNGGRMEYCKHYLFRYWWIQPPKLYQPPLNTTLPINGTQPLPSNYTSPIGDAWVKLYLNGTTNVSVIPRKLVVWLGATGTENNTVTVEINMTAGRLDSNDKPVVLMNEKKTYILTIPANESYMMQIDIQKFIAKAIEYAPRGFFEAEARITDATYNNVFSNDYDRVVYFPPSTIQPNKPVTFTVRVINAINRTPISGATVYLDGELFGTTDVNGTVSGSTITGLHTLKVVYSGYKIFEKDINVFDNMTYVVELMPEGVTGYNLLQVLVQYKDGAPYKGAVVTVKDNATGTVIFNDTTDSVGLAEFYIESGKVVDVQITAGNYSENYTGIVMNKDVKVVFTVPVNSPYFEPEVAINDVKILIHKGMGYFYGSVPHYVKVWVFTNVPQTIDLYLRLYDKDTNRTIAEKTITVTLHKGLNCIRTWLNVSIYNESVNATIYARIAKYEFDTNPDNNEMVGNTVMLKPFVDLSVLITWKPVKQKVKFAILPEDVIEIDVGFMIPPKLSNIMGNVSIFAEDLYAKKPRIVHKYHEKMTTHKPNTTIWYNTTIVVPFTDKIIVNASVYHPWDYNGLNNNMTLVIDIYPDNKLEFAKPELLVVSSGSAVPVKVHIKSNAIGQGLTVSVVDMNTYDLIGIKHLNITEPEFDVTISGKAPAINGIAETHTWNATLSASDFYTADNYKTFEVTIWNVPWWFWVLLIFIVVIAILGIIKSLIASARRYAEPDFRFYRKYDEEGGDTADGKLMSTEGKGLKRFKFFRRFE